MKTVIVRPERCVGCLQCRFACAVAHSFTKSPYTAPYERILSKPRIHIGLSAKTEPFPNKCRHCEPAPCQMVCPTRAVHRASSGEIVLIDADKCIKCGQCAMACPFGVIRYHRYPNDRIAAHKCDQCISRQREGNIPACVEVCKVGALVFGDVNDYMDWESDRLSSFVYSAISENEPERGPYESLQCYRCSYGEIKRRQS